MTEWGAAQRKESTFYPDTWSRGTADNSQWTLMSKTGVGGYTVEAGKWHKRERMFW